MPNLNEVLKQLSLETYQSTMPSGIYFGTVISTSPLKVSVEQKMTLTSKQLVLTSLVQDYSVDMTVSGNTKSYKVHLGLKAGEKVMLIRVQGGQKFIVLDRIRG